MTFTEWRESVWPDVKEALDFIGQKVSLHPAQQTEALAKIMAYLALLNEKMPTAKDYYRQAYAMATESVLEKHPKAGANQQRAIAEGIASQEKMFYDLIERASATCVHQIDAYRTLISANKAEQRYSNLHGG